MFWTKFVERNADAKCEKRNIRTVYSQFIYSAQSSVLEIIGDYGSHAHITDLSGQLCAHRDVSTSSGQSAEGPEIGKK